ncbi:PP2C family serine/threonine-protein phosphatase [Legionella waltersii]|uniref:Protein phosphatase 2C n=1 Tax=Legionella waltersii TaxID=66969 RepID=A0A0W1A1T3_9GAMM|nr:PP2C family serine/threonine-protein phosphatase [Legionella waltersii]KTD75307.1 Protein phosphatase 2C [Legionella waltersii]SNV07064.1 Protein phosphatase 2C [Legionella waltersii]
MPEIISTSEPDASRAEGLNNDYSFGYVEIIGGRETQEDALAWHVLSANDLTPKDSLKQLSPIEIGYRLWTSYQLLDTPDLEAGTTASTTVYDGKGNLITATVADSASFAVVYDKDGNALGVTRLNSVTHKASDKQEALRIQNNGGFVQDERVNGVLAPSRSIGDKIYKGVGVSSEATIDITNVDQITRDLKLDPSQIGSIQIITTCDGFTDGAGDDKQNKKNHESYLFDTLKRLRAPGKLPQNELANCLCQRALTDRSYDNISVAIQTITKDTPPVLVGVYDGHGGHLASHKVAKNIGQVFKELCALTLGDYEKHKLSVFQHVAAYLQDNRIYLDPELQNLVIVNELITLTRIYLDDLKDSENANTIQPILLCLFASLNSDKPNKDKIIEFYTFLDKNHTLENAPMGKNIDLIRQDTRKSTGEFILGIAIIAATLLTLILPGLLIMSIVYAATGKQPLDLMTSKGTRFEESVNKIKTGMTFFSHDLPSQSQIDDLIISTEPKKA